MSICKQRKCELCGVDDQHYVRCSITQYHFIPIYKFIVFTNVGKKTYLFLLLSTKCVERVVAETLFQLRRTTHC